MKKILFTLLLFYISSSISFAQLSLPSIFGDKMVLQQDSKVKIWGRADTGKPVFITTSWDKQKYKVIPDAVGEWHLKFQTLIADGIPYQIKIEQADQEKVFTDILFGEVWLCTGQSNMEMKMKGYYGNPIIGGPEAILNSINPNLRLFEVAKAFDATPLFNCNGTWQEANTESVSNFSAAAYFFGNQLQKTLGVPVALISAPWGGAAIEAFMSKEAFQDFSQKKIPLSKKEIKNPIKTPTALFNGMIQPLVGYSIKGCIWYQGESNRNKPEEYRKLFKSFLADWRSKWEVGDFGFHFAQIAPFNYKDGNSAYIREAQAICVEENKNSYMISLLDVGEEKDIHPSEKRTVGFRLAQSALEKTYKYKGIVSDGPIYKSMTIENNKVTILFEKQEQLTTYGQPLNQFEVAGPDRIFHSAKAHIVNNKIVVLSDKVMNPVAVRYAFKNWAKGTLYNIHGAPASSFRTDIWEETK